MPRDPRAFLWDVRSAADKIASFVRGKTVDEFTRDELLHSAVERQLEIIGEVQEILDGYPQLWEADVLALYRVRCRDGPGAVSRAAAAHRSLQFTLDKNKPLSCVSVPFPPPVALSRLSPAREERSHEPVRVGWLHRKRCQRHRHREGHVVSVGACPAGARVGGVGRVDPHGGLDQPTELAVLRPALQLDAEPVMGRTLGSVRVAGHHRASSGSLPLALWLLCKVSWWRRCGLGLDGFPFLGPRRERNPSRSRSRTTRSAEREAALAARPSLNERR